MSSRIALLVGGSIAAYKAVDLTSKLVQAGHQVDVVMTREATRFIQPLSFGALTHRRVYTDEIWGDDERPAAHLESTAEAQVIIVAPCTANLIGKFAHGIADEIVSTTWIGADAPCLVAPAMNARMWRHPRVQANVEILKTDGVTFVGPETGYLAEGEEGPGRMTEPDGIIAAMGRLLG